MLSTMPYFLEYVTDVGAGRLAVEGTDFTNVLAKAKEALRGLDCSSAALLFSSGPNPVFGKGSILAAYTQADGWSTQQTWPE